MAFDAEIGDDAIGFVSRIDPEAAEIGVEVAARRINRTRVPDGDGPDDADRPRAEGGARGRTENEIGSPAADALRKGPTDALESASGEQRGHDLDRRYADDRAS